MHNDTKTRTLGAEAAASQDAILSIDIGGTLIKASVVSRSGAMLVPWVRVPTPSNATPQRVLATIAGIVRDFPPFDKASIAFPGVVQHGVVKTAPNLATGAWLGHDFRAEIRSAFDCDVRILNDAIVQGLGVASGPGVDCILTLGTGLGCALFKDSRFLIQLELGQQLGLENLKFDDYVGHSAFLAVGEAIWNERASRTISVVRNLTHPNRILICGGNARRITFSLPADVELFPMTAGITGGARLWDSSVAEDFERDFR